MQEPKTFVPAGVLVVFAERAKNKKGKDRLNIQHPQSYKMHTQHHGIATPAHQVSTNQEADRGGIQPDDQEKIIL